MNSKGRHKWKKRKEEVWKHNVELEEHSEKPMDHAVSTESDTIITDEEAERDSMLGSKVSTATIDSIDESRPTVLLGSNDSGDGAHQVKYYHVYKRRWVGLVIIMLLNVISSWSWISFASIQDQTAAFFNLSSVTPVNWLSTEVLFSYVFISPISLYCLIKRGTRDTVNLEFT